MFRKFFSALSTLTANMEALASSVKEANDNFRANVLGESSGEPAQLEHHDSTPDEPAKNGRRRVATK
jgi:hypothetical protein